MQLEKNMYVRTDKGRIGKVLTERYEYKDDYNQEIQFKNGVEDTWDMDWEDIIKASHNIIDLIEVGDYVNGVRIDELSHNRFTNAKAVATNNSLRKDTGKQYWFENEDIKSILTKEQFEQMQYKVGE